MRRRALGMVFAAVAAIGAAKGNAAVAPDVRIVDYDSPAVARQMKYAVLLPNGYEAGDTHWPVLYLLHGHTGHHLSWLTYARLPRDSADRLGAIVVLADGGNTFYVNWHGAEGDRPQRWGDAIAVDLVDHVDRTFRTCAAREGRAIGGLSMGGYGAITLALQHPGRFAAAFSSAGALHFARRAQDELRRGTEDWNRPELWSGDTRPAVAIEGFATQRERTPAGRVFDTAEQAAASDPFELARRLSPSRAPYLHLDAGTQDLLADETRAFVALLRERGMRHSYIELPGAHEVPYWANAFEHTALILRPLLSRCAAKGVE